MYTWICEYSLGFIYERNTVNGIDLLCQLNFEGNECGFNVCVYVGNIYAYIYIQYTYWYIYWASLFRH